MGRTNFTSGTLIKSAEVNDNFISNEIKEIYTGAALDGSATAGATDSNNYEFTAITSANLGSSDYLDIEVNASLSCRAYQTDDGSVAIKIETKEVGGSYSTSLTQTDIFKVNGLFSGSDTGPVQLFYPFKHTHTLTAGEKSNGVQVKITVVCTSTGGSGTASFTNKQVLIRNRF